MRNWESSFSAHAIDRCNLRLSIPREVLKGYLDSDQLVSLGTENVTNRASRLLYSPADDGFFVTVQDMSNGEIVTILPIHYWHNLSKKRGGLKTFIEIRDFKKAIKLTAPDHEYIEYLNQAPSNSLPNIKLHGIISQQNESQKKVNLGALDFEEIELLSAESLRTKLLTTILDAILERDLNYHSLIAIFWRMGSNPNWEEMEFNETGVALADSSLIFKAIENIRAEHILWTGRYSAVLNLISNQ